MMTTFDFNDGNGPVPAHKHPNGGGWVADTAKVDETAYVGRDARVYGNAMVYDTARVYGDAQVYDYARVYDNAMVGGYAMVYDNAMIGGYAMVYGNATVGGDTYRADENILRSPVHPAGVRIEINGKQYKLVEIV